MHEFKMACMGAHGSSSGAPGLGDDARLGDGDIGLGLVTGVGRGGLNLLDDVHALDDPAEDHVTAIEPAESRGTGMRTRGTRIPPQTARRRKAAQEVFSPRSGNSGDEELGTVGVGTRVGHGEEERFCRGKQGLLKSVVDPKGHRYERFIHDTFHVEGREIVST